MRLRKSRLVLEELVFWSIYELAYDCASTKLCILFVTAWCRSIIVKRHSFWFGCIQNGLMFFERILTVCSLFWRRFNGLLLNQIVFCDWLFWSCRSMKILNSSSSIIHIILCMLIIFAIILSRLNTPISNCYWRSYWISNIPLLTQI